MISFLKGLFGSSKSAETVIDTAAKGIYNGIDAMVFTEEEKSQARQKGFDSWLKFYEIAYDQNSVRSITRRWVAFMILGPMTLYSLAAAVLTPFYPEYAKFLFSLVQEYSPVAMVIIAFYFGPHALKALRE